MHEPKSKDPILSCLDAAVIYLNKNSGLFIFIATFALAIITYYYLVETRKTRELLQDDLFRRSLPVMFIPNPKINIKNGEIKTSIEIINKGAPAYDLNIVIFWFDGNKKIFSNTAFSYIGDVPVPLYRYKFNHPAEAIATITLPHRNKVENPNEVYILIILKYKIPINQECIFEKHAFKHESSAEIGRWNYIPFDKEEELYKKATEFKLKLESLTPNDENTLEIAREINTFLDFFFNNKNCATNSP